MNQAENINISNPGTIAENITIEAEQVAGRDLYKIEMKEIADNSRLLFSNIDVSPYSEENYTSPCFTSELLQRTLDTHILIFSGGQGFDKGSFVRHLAHLIKSEVSEYELKEIQSNTENQSLFRDLLQGEEKLIYILDQLHPQHFDYDLEKFSRIANQKKLYLLVTTDLSIDTWDLQGNARNQYSFIIPTKDLYESEVLDKCLQNALNRQKDFLAKTLPTELHGTSQLFEKPLSQIAKELSTPEGISFFVSLLCRQQEEITIEKFEETFNEVKNSSQSLVTKWFRSLDHKQKLVALGVSLLEGMYDDQFFGVMEEIVDGFWMHSDPALLALDYIDLEFLWDYFKLEATNDDKQILKNRFPNQRTDIIKAAWSSHRRHILAILPILVKVANNSVKKQSSSWEKYGTRQRQMNIRLAISTTIGDLGLVSVSSIENALIELAAQENSTLQRVAAKSLARWREFDQDERLFATLKSWLENERIQNLLNDFLARRNNDQIKIGSRASSYLKATAVLALSYSANYDSPNHLNAEIINLIREIAIDSDGLVRTRIQEALPRIIHHHVLQLKDVLVEDLIKYDDLAIPIGDGLSRAYYDYPSDLKTTLFQWLKTCLESSSKSNQRKKFTFRDKVLVTVFETFQRIDFNTTSDAIKIDEVYGWLLKFSQIEKRSTVRESLFLTLGKIISLDWVKAERNLSKFFPSNELKETKVIVEKFTQVYLEQRRSLDGAKHEIRWQEDHYPTWLAYKERPFTEIERVMLDWMDKGDLVLKQISTLSFLNFAKVFEEEELDQIELLKDRLQKQRILQQSMTQAAKEPILSNDLKPSEPAISLWTRIYIFFLLLFESKDNKLTLRAILKLLYKYPDFSRKHLHLVFIKWVRSSSKTTRKLANWLSRLVR